MTSFHCGMLIKWLHNQQLIDIIAFGLKGETNLKSKDVEERFNDIINADKFICTEEEFNNFQNYGYILSVGDRYLTKMGKVLNIDIIK